MCSTCIHRYANRIESLEIDPFLAYARGISQTTEAKTAILPSKIGTTRLLVGKRKRSIPQNIEKNKLQVHHRSKCKI